MAATNDNTPLFRFRRDRQEIIDEVIERVTRGAIQRAWEDDAQGLEYLLNEAAYLEMSRMDDGQGSSTGLDYGFWKGLAHRLGRASEEENAEALQRIVTTYASDIAGQFRPSVFRVATQVLPTGISFLFNRQSGSRLLRLPGEMQPLEAKLGIEGDLARLQRLAEIGTLVVVPTHSSHMDSPLIGWALHASGLPPVTYGAGKNLFTNPLTSFFMANLGAYKVDRRLKHNIYVQVLKQYSQVLLERGYHSLFFPGGGRSRSNEVESRLKLGLLGTSLEAWSRNVIRGRARPIFVVPVTINYNLVLESETLIGDHLRTDGKGRFIIEDDEFSDVRVVAHYVRSTLEMDATVRIRFCPPLDLFGNEVDDRGRTIDQRGRVVDVERYIWVDGTPASVRGRDQQYTRELGSRVADAFRRNTILFPLHVVSFALFEHMRRQHPGWDLYRTLRFCRGDTVRLVVVEGETERLVRLLREAEQRGELRLDESVTRHAAPTLVEEALRYWNSYHPTPVAVREAERIRITQPNLLYYYGGRVRGYDMERLLGQAAGGA
ncbi:MAG: hypothetical protein EA398_00385 [Deltaproteobacteria bacterium]|nr:MAG: hypothetical protein EA398_00385 [Deltaproteobacteria bacterium]